jgi:hypothetical protein
MNSIPLFTKEFRSSKSFTLLVVCIAVFSDVFIYGLMIPVMPFALTDRLGIPEKDVQKWNSVLLGLLGGAILFGSCTLAPVPVVICMQILTYT